MDTLILSFPLLFRKVKTFFFVRVLLCFVFFFFLLTEKRESWDIHIAWGYQQLILLQICNQSWNKNEPQIFSRSCYSWRSDNNSGPKEFSFSWPEFVSPDMISVHVFRESLSITSLDKSGHFWCPVRPYLYSLNKLQNLLVFQSHHETLFTSCMFMHA